MNKNIWPEVCIVIPVYKNSQLDIDILEESIANLSYPKDKLKITKVSVDSENKIIGYAQAANNGILKNKSDLFLLINADVKLDKFLLKTLVSFIQKNPKVAIVGPKVYAMNKPDQISLFDLPVIGFNRVWGRMKTVNLNWLSKKNKPFSVSWISGSCMLFKADVWKKLKGFDENFFMYWEDADFCMRAENLGNKTILVPQAKIWHRSAGSIGKENPDRIYYIKRNSLYFLKKYSRFPGNVLNQIITMFVLIVKIIKLFYSEIDISKAYIFAVVDYYRGIKGRRK